MTPQILLLGSTGMLGKDALSNFLNRGWAVRSPWRNDLDVTTPQGIESIRRRDWGSPTHIVNCTGYTAVDKAESEAMAAMRLNAVAPGALAFVAKELGATLIHISTDFVFDGFSKTPYTEDSPPNPLGIYGKSKLQGEQNVLAEWSNSIILRTSWLYGSGGKSFPATMIQKYREGVALRVVNDQKGCPTSTVDLAESIAQAIEQLISGGIYHCCGPEPMTWFEFARAAIETARAHGGGPEVQLEPCTTADYPTPARRPAYSVLNCTKLQAAGVAAHRPFRESLTEFVVRLDQ